MTLPELAAALKPIADRALSEGLDQHPDSDVVKASVVLAALMGAIDGGDVDRDVLDVLAINCGLICEHQTARHSTWRAGQNHARIPHDRDDEIP